jgi:hypothetical protein
MVGMLCWASHGSSAYSGPRAGQVVADLIRLDLIGAWDA